MEKIDIEKVKKSLKHCISLQNCSTCPFIENETWENVSCIIALMSRAYTCIEELQKKAEHYKQAYKDEVDSKAEAIKKLQQENVKLGCFNVMNQEAIKMAHKRIQELEEQLAEYHKYDGFLAVHGIFEVETDG